MLDRGFNKLHVDYMLILNDDIVFGKTTQDMKNLVKKYPDAFILNCGTWGVFLMSHACYQTVGTFDPNFFPAYYEDNDYAQRLYAIERKGLIAKGLREMRPKVSRTSQTIAKSPGLNKNFGKNGRYFREKWGGAPEHAKYRFPFNKMPDSKICVITRTAGRPNFFKQCYESVKSQDCPNIKHIVIVDEHIPKHYTKGYPDIKVLKLNREQFVSGGSGYFNHYLNYAICMLNPNDRFCILDDDDLFTSPTAVSTAIKHMGTADMIIWKVRAAGGIVPFPQYFNKKEIVFANIAMPGFMAKRSIAQNVYTDYQTCGDFRFIRDLNAASTNTIWLNKVLASTNPVSRQGKGGRRDFPYDAIARGASQVLADSSLK